TRIDRRQSDRLAALAGAARQVYVARTDSNDTVISNRNAWIAFIPPFNSKTRPGAQTPGRVRSAISGLLLCRPGCAALDQTENRSRVRASRTRVRRGATQR